MGVQCLAHCMSRITYMEMEKKMDCCTASDLISQGFQFPLKVENENEKSCDWLPSSFLLSSAWFQIQLLGKVHRLALPRCNCTERKQFDWRLLEEDKRCLVLERGIEHLDKHTGDRWKLRGDPVYIRGSDRLSDSIGLHPCHRIVPPRTCSSWSRLLNGLFAPLLAVAVGSSVGPEGYFWVHADGIIMSAWQI